MDFQITIEDENGSNIIEKLGIAVTEAGIPGDTAEEKICFYLKETVRKSIVSYLNNKEQIKVFTEAEGTIKANTFYGRDINVGSVVV